MPRVHMVKKARKPDEHYGIEVGDTYYWWKFAFGPKVKSKTYPKRSQLTRSAYYGQFYDIEDGFDPQTEGLDDAIEAFESLKGEIEGMLEEVEEKKMNMESYEGLSETPAYELLEQREEALSEFINEIETAVSELETARNNLPDELEAAAQEAKEEEDEDFDEEDWKSNYTETAITEAQDGLSWTYE